uniref:Secreted peptide n=1 Tax=Anopheles braziliensis TaxID=58242 RepID=A0A2M3ZM41_9DIPT
MFWLNFVIGISFSALTGSTGARPASTEIRHTAASSLKCFRTIEPIIFPDYQLSIRRRFAVLFSISPPLRLSQLLDAPTDEDAGACGLLCTFRPVNYYLYLF